VSTEKTEQPTAKKLRDARRRGEVARSRDLPAAAGLLVLAAAIGGTGEAVVLTFRDTFALAVSTVSASTPPSVLLSTALGSGAAAIAPLLLALTAGAVVVSFLQIGPVYSVEPLRPRLERIDPWRGVIRLFSPQQLVELLKSLVKMLLIGVVAALAVREGLRGILGLVARDAQAALEAGGALGRTILWRAGLIMGVVAVLDVLYQRWRFRRDQRMTKLELRREVRDAEGDPNEKQHRQRLHREIVAHATLEDVRRADVVVVNPTHLAVALSYDEEGERNAPEVLAKGQDDLARRMIEVADQEGIPVMQDVPLARALHELEVGEEIPEVLYEAVALVLRAAWDERAHIGSTP
jgi:flagellar biosynthesis protein FlhB